MELRLAERDGYNNRANIIRARLGVEAIRGEYPNVWAVDQRFVRARIEAGRIKGSDASIDDTTADLTRFSESSAGCHPPRFCGHACCLASLA